MNARAERRAMIALVAVFALFVQALIPGLAAAGTMSGPGMTICTDMGLAPLPADGGQPATPAHACDHCLCPSLAPALPAPAAGSAAPVRYAVVLTADARPTLAVAPGRGLAAPPPPSRGPPRSEA